MSDLKQCGICNKKIGILTGKYIINNKTECVCTDCLKTHLLDKRSVWLTPKTLNSLTIDAILNNPKSIGKSKPNLISSKENTSSSSAFGFTLTNNSIQKGAEEKSLNNVVARVESGSELQSRVTMTRLVALGIFAFAAKKKKGGEKYLTIDGPDFVWTAEIKRDKKDINKAMNFAAQINTNAKNTGAKVSPNPIATSSPSLSVVEELKKFKELLDLGVINQEEFEIQKSKLLK